MFTRIAPLVRRTSGSFTLINVDTAMSPVMSASPATICAKPSRRIADDSSVPGLKPSPRSRPAAGSRGRIVRVPLPAISTDPNDQFALMPSVTSVALVFPSASTPTRSMDPDFAFRFHCTHPLEGASPRSDTGRPAALTRRDVEPATRRPALSVSTLANRSSTEPPPDVSITGAFRPQARMPPRCVTPA